MVGLDDVIEILGELPEVEEGTRYGQRTWLVGGKAFAWERPFSDATPPDGPIVAVTGDRR